MANQDEVLRLTILMMPEIERMLEDAGAFMSGSLLCPPGAGASDSSDALAALDAIERSGLIRKITGPEAWGQHQVYVRNRS